MPSTYDVVVVGGSFSGVHTAHHLLKAVFPSLEDTGLQYRVIMLTNSSKMFHKIAAPRMLVSPDLLALERGLAPIAPGFEQYGESFKLVTGYATSIAPSKRIISYDGTEGTPSGTLKYDSLVLVPGTTVGSPLWSIAEGWEKLVASHEELQRQLQSANTILVAGGGPVGIETVGELGYKFGHSKEIVLYSGSSRLAATLKNTAYSADVEKKLKKLGPQIIHNVKVLSTAKGRDGRTTVRLDNGEDKVVDVYIPATGDKPSTGFVPAEWLNERKRIKTDAHTLRLDVPGIENVYATGSAASFSNGNFFDATATYKALGESFRIDQLPLQKRPTTQKIVYKKIMSDMQLVPIGPNDGAGVLFGWRVPAFIPTMMKSKDYFIGKFPGIVNGNAV